MYLEYKNNSLSTHVLHMTSKPTHEYSVNDTYALTDFNYERLVDSP